MTYNIPKILFVCLVVAAIIYAGAKDDFTPFSNADIPKNEVVEQQESIQPDEEPNTAPEVKPEIVPTPDPVVDPVPDTVPDEVPVDVPTHDFALPVPESDPVEDSWFDDAVFLGDSRTDGLRIFSGLKTGTYFCNTGISIFHVAKSDRQTITVNGEKMTVVQALGTGTWNKVYIMFGTNDLGYSASAYEEALTELVDAVLQLQPQAVVYLQTMPPVNEAQAKANKLSSFVTNAKIEQFNEAIVRVAAEKQVVLVDVASCLRSENGDLDERASSDGVHFYKGGYQTWLAYLRSHTLDNENYHRSREEAATNIELKEAAA